MRCFRSQLPSNKNMFILCILCIAISSLNQDDDDALQSSGSKGDQSIPSPLEFKRPLPDDGSLASSDEEERPPAKQGRIIQKAIRAPSSDEFEDDYDDDDECSDCGEEPLSIPDVDPKSLVAKAATWYVHNNVFRFC